MDRDEPHGGSRGESHRAPACCVHPSAAVRSAAADAAPTNRAIQPSPRRKSRGERIGFGGGALSGQSRVNPERRRNGELPAHDCARMVGTASFRRCTVGSHDAGKDTSAAVAVDVVPTPSKREGVPPNRRAAADGA